MMIKQNDDIQKRKEIYPRSLMKKTGGFCKGICKQFEVKRGGDLDKFYSDGIVRCTNCSIFINTIQFKTIFDFKKLFGYSHN